MDRPSTDTTRPVALALMALAVLGLALIPRTHGLADFITTDEAYHWIDRTDRFSIAIAGQHWAATLVTGHPGVTTMWLGSIGMALEQLFGHTDTTIPTLVAHLAWLRLPAAILHALVIALAFLLLNRLFGRSIGLIASGLWATAPYLIAHGRLLHVDANLTDFVILSMLFLLVAFAERAHAAQRTPQLGYLGASGVLAGLALLTKGPALVLLPFVGLTIFALVFQNRQHRVAVQQSPSPHWMMLAARCIPRSVLLYICWLAAALLVVGALWPAMWVIPGPALERYIGEITTNGGRPNGDGQFFFGRADADPGPFFYLVADLFRMTPAMLIGLLCSSVFGLRYWLARRPFDPRAAVVRNLIILAAFVIFWTMVMMLGPKKFDRYILPTWPALIILAAAGLSALLSAVPRRSLRTLVVSLGLASELVIVSWYQPYYLSYYNPLLGGGQVAQQIFLIGWGEGMDQVGAYLRERPDLRYGPVLSALGATLQPFVPVDVRDVEDFGSLPANYAVVYRESVQRAANPPLYAQLQTTIPLQTITIHGIDYAWIYQLPRPFRQPIDASFGETLRLRGVTIEQTTSRLVITPAWDVRLRPPGTYAVFVHVLNPQGMRVAQINIALGGGNAAPTTEWQAGQQIAVPLPIDLPPNLAGGAYQLVLGVYDVASGTRLALTGGTRADPALAGNDALLVTTITLP